MFEWLFGNRYKKLEEKTQEGFNSVKRDMDVVGKWVKHLDRQDKQLFDMIKDIKKDLSTIKEDMEDLKEREHMGKINQKGKQVFEKMGVWDKQGGVFGVQKPVQTAVQTGNFYEILKKLSSNERLVVFTLLNSDMKLSYEDLALLLGKERATIRGQINTIKQKNGGLIEEIIEKNGKKRVFVPQEIREKLQKYAKVRVKKEEKERKVKKKMKLRKKVREQYRIASEKEVRGKM